MMYLEIWREGWETIVDSYSPRIGTAAGVGNTGRGYDSKPTDFPDDLLLDAVRNQTAAQISAKERSSPTPQVRGLPRSQEQSPSKAQGSHTPWRSVGTMPPECLDFLSYKLSSATEAFFGVTPKQASEQWKGPSLIPHTRHNWIIVNSSHTWKRIKALENTF